MDRIEWLAERAFLGFKDAGEEPDWRGGVDGRIEAVGRYDLRVHVGGVGPTDGDEDIGPVKAAGGSVEGKGPASGGCGEDDGVAWRRGLDGKGRPGVGLRTELGPVP